MKTPRSLFCFGAACILLSTAGVCLAVAIKKSCVFSISSFSFAILVSLISVVLSLTIGRRSLFELFSAIHADIRAYLRWSERMNKSVAHWFYWRLVHPIFWRLVHCWDVISRRRGLIVIVVVLTVALVVVITFLIRPTFASTARISIRNDW